MEETEIDTFFSQLEKGMLVENFLSALDGIYGVTRRLEMAIQFRQASGSMKSLRDEVTPIARFVRKFAKSDDIIFKPKKDPPDLIVHHKDGINETIECTTAGAVARHFLNMELATTGLSRGFLGLIDDSPWEEFESEMAKEREMITTDHAYKVAAGNLKSAIERKSNIIGCDTLIIEGLNLWVLKAEAWLDYASEFEKIVASASNFSSVYYVAHLRPGEICLKIK